MPRDVIQANFEQLEQIAQHFSERADNTQQVLQTVRRCMDDLQKDGWWGVGADAFYAEMEDDVLPRVVRLQNALTRASETTRRIAEILGDAEEHAAGGFKDSSGTGGGGFVGGAVGGASTGGGSRPGGGASGGGGGAVGGAVGGGSGGGTQSNASSTGNGVAGGGGGGGVGGGSSAGGVPGGAGGGFAGGGSSTNGYQTSAEKAGKLGLKVMKDRAVSYAGTQMKEFLKANASNSAIAKQMTDMLEKYPAAGKVLGKIGGAAGGGMIDFALGGKYTGKEFGVQMVSAGLQIPLSKVKLVEAGIQIAGNASAELVERNARWISNNDQFLEGFIKNRAQGFERALGNLSIDGTVDGVVRSFADDGLSWKAVGNSAGHLGNWLVNGVGGTVVEGTGMIGGTLYGLGDRAVDGISEAADTVSEAAGDVVDALKFW